MSQQTTNRYFDELASGLASGSISRGKALKLMGAALLGGMLTSLGMGEAGADNLCKPEGKKCRNDAQCCSGFCDEATGTCAPQCQVDSDCDDNNECTLDVCIDGMCVHTEIEC